MERAFIVRGASFGMILCGCVSFVVLAIVANMLPLDRATQTLVIGLTGLLELSFGIIAYITSRSYAKDCQEKWRS